LLDLEFLYGRDIVEPPAIASSPPSQRIGN